jgi:hypothetical protein
MTPFYQPGKYKGVVTDQALGKNTKTGTPQFVLRVRIVAKLIDGNEELCKVQQERTIYMYLSEKAAKYTIEKLQGIGFAGSSIRQLDLSHSDAHDFREQVVELVCNHEDDQNGDEREKWDLVWGSGGIEITPLDAAEARKLDALFGKSLKAGNGAAPPAKRQQQPKPVAVAAHGNDDPSDDDVPF